ncbi:hypothetical protein F5141DRAFT_1140440 [Pisolithus sp. B1]|nr:hypothetical protein F5141DRAFT_1140440 [Pisolithus sp. B1]
MKLPASSTTLEHPKFRLRFFVCRRRRPYTFPLGLFTALQATKAGRWVLSCQRCLHWQLHCRSGICILIPKPKLNYTSDELSTRGRCLIRGGIAKNPRSQRTGGAYPPRSTGGTKNIIKHPSFPSKYHLGGPPGKECNSPTHQLRLSSFSNIQKLRFWFHTRPQRGTWDIRR